MPLVVADRVQETGTANTTVSFTLSGSVTGFQSFAVIGNTNITYYAATDGSGNWEVGLGTYSTTGPTLTRTTILSSSNSGLAVTFTGTVNVFVTYPAGESVYYQDTGGVVITEAGTADALRVTNTGTGNSFVVEDAANPDSTPFIVNASGNVGIGSTTASQKLDVTGNIKWSGATYENVFTITDGAAFEINPENGTIQLITLGASRTPKATNFAAGQAITFMVDDGTAYTITWTDTTFGPSGVIWKTDAGNAPTLNTTGYTVIVLWKVNTQVYGARVGNA